MSSSSHHDDNGSEAPPHFKRLESELKSAKTYYKNNEKREKQYKVEISRLKKRPEASEAEKAKNERKRSAAVQREMSLGPRAKRSRGEAVFISQELMPEISPKYH